MTDENRTLKDAFYGGKFRVGQGIYTRSVSQGETILTEATFENIQTWDELTDQTETDEAFDELTDSEQSMDDCTESSVAFDLVTDKEVAMDKVTDKEMPMDKVTDKEMPMDKVTDKEMPMDKVTDKEVAMDKVTDKEVAMDKVTDKEMPMDKVTDKEMPMDKITDKEVAMDKVTDKEVAMDKVTDKEMPRTKVLLSDFWGKNWDKNTSSEKWWTNAGTFSGNANDSLIDSPNFAGNALGLICSGEDSSITYSFTLDLTDVQTLELWQKNDDSGTNWVSVIEIDNDEVLDDSGSTDWTERSFDVSSYSGSTEIKLIGEDQFGEGTEGRGPVGYAEMRLIE